MIAGEMYFFERANKSLCYDKSASNNALILTIEAFIEGCIGLLDSQGDNPYNVNPGGCIQPQWLTQLQPPGVVYGQNNLSVVQPPGVVKRSI